MYYSEESLMVSVMFFASAAMLFGAFIVRYRIEVFCSFRSLRTCWRYLRVSNERGSAIQNFEKVV